MHKFSPFSVKMYTYVVARGGTPLPKKIILQAKYAHFQANLQKYITSGGCEGAALSFHKRMCISGNHKCTISVPFLTHNFRPFVV